MKFLISVVNKWNSSRINSWPLLFVLYINDFPLCQLSDNFTVKVNNIPIEKVIVYKSLGVSIDENLFWKTHIDEISKKISTGQSVLKRKSNHAVQN